MSELNISKTTTPTVLTDTTIDSETTDGVSGTGETYYDNKDFTDNYGIYKNDAKVKTAMNGFATWVLGLGWTADPATTVELEHIIGSGEDTFLSILWNAIVVKKFHGDSYTEDIKDKKSGKRINLKPLSPSSIRVVYSPEGIIERYEQRIKGKPNKKLTTNQILHLANDRIADNTHGTSVLEAVKWNVEARKEAKETHRKMIKRNGVVRVIEVDTVNTVKLAKFKEEWKDAIDKGDVLILPKNVAEAKDWHGTLDTAGVLAWLSYLDDELLQLLGIPKIIVGASGDIEGDSKISYLTFEQVYLRAVKELQDDLWKQLSIKVEFNKPASLKQEIASNEAANTSQTGFQPNDTTAGVGV